MTIHPMQRISEIYAITINIVFFINCSYCPQQGNEVNTISYQEDEDHEEEDDHSNEDVEVEKLEKEIPEDLEPVSTELPALPEEDDDDDDNKDEGKV